MGDDNLVIEVWDFDPAETIGEKMSKILDIKGVRGFRKLMKEIAVTASTGKHDNEFIGKCVIPLKVSAANSMTFFPHKQSHSKLTFYLSIILKTDDIKLWLDDVVQFGQKGQTEASRLDQIAIIIQRREEQ